MFFLFSRKRFSFFQKQGKYFLLHPKVQIFDCFGPFLCKKIDSSREKINPAPFIINSIQAK
jgi:hypothetical protein